MIREVVVLRSKMYSVFEDTIDPETKKQERKHGKGLKKYIVERYLKHKDYLNTLLQNVEQQNVQMNMSRQSNHTIYNITKEKKSIAADDDKRCYIDNVNSYAYGHYRTINSC